MLFDWIALYSPGDGGAGGGQDDGGEGGQGEGGNGDGGGSGGDSQGDEEDPTVAYLKEKGIDPTNPEALIAELAKQKEVKDKVLKEKKDAAAKLKKQDAERADEQRKMEAIKNSKLFEGEVTPEKLSEIHSTLTDKTSRVDRFVRTVQMLQEQEVLSESLADFLLSDETDPVTIGLSLNALIKERETGGKSDDEDVNELLQRNGARKEGTPKGKGKEEVDPSTRGKEFLKQYRGSGQQSDTFSALFSRDKKT